jgi:phage antirepressor YoqD-like protein
MANGNESIDISCTLDMAKHLILQMPTENAHKYRQYLIDFESVGKFKLPQTYKEALIELVVQVEKNEILELENKKQQEVIEMQKPKADYFDCLVETNLLTNFRDSAKGLGIKQNEFMKFLEDKKFIYRDKRDKPKPYAHHVDNGLFELRDFTSGSYSDVRTFITVKGKETFRLLLQVR